MYIITPLTHLLRTHSFILKSCPFDLQLSCWMFRNFSQELPSLSCQTSTMTGVETLAKSNTASHTSLKFSHNGFASLIHSCALWKVPKSSQWCTTENYSLVCCRLRMQHILEENTAAMWVSRSCKWQNRIQVRVAFHWHLNHPSLFLKWWTVAIILKAYRYSIARAPARVHWSCSISYQNISFICVKYALPLGSCIVSIKSAVGLSAWLPTRQQAYLLCLWQVRLSGAHVYPHR